MWMGLLFSGDESESRGIISKDWVTDQGKLDY